MMRKISQRLSFERAQLLRARRDSIGLHRTMYMWICAIISEHYFHSHNPTCFVQSFRDCSGYSNQIPDHDGTSLNCRPSTMEGMAEPEISRSFISDSHDKCFRSFAALITAIRHPVRDFGDQIPLWEVMNEFDRYKIWAGNVGAMHKGRQYQISLDYRLSEAAFYRQQVYQPS